MKYCKKLYSKTHQILNITKIILTNRVSFQETHIPETIVIIKIVAQKFNLS